MAVLMPDLPLEDLGSPAGLFQERFRRLLREGRNTRADILDAQTQRLLAEYPNISVT